MDWTVVQRDFIERTLLILDQYDDYVTQQRASLSHFEELETTLLVNCLTGLVVFPYEYAHRDMRDEKPGNVQVCAGDLTSIKALDGNWGLQKISIEKICDFSQKNFVEPPTEATLRLFVYRMRNALAHSRFDSGGPAGENGVKMRYHESRQDPNKSRIISLIFQDVNPNRPSEIRFKAEITVEGLRQFAKALAKAVLEI